MIKLNKNNIELLAPAGSKESVKAAVNNGCDAIYLGGKSFSARQYAGNFSNDEIMEILDYCHLRDVKVYVTVNTLYKQKELEELFRFINVLYQLGVDGFIVQDLGTATEIRRLFPDINLHGSTQMTIHNLEAVKFIQELNFKRIVLSRELTLDEIAYIAKNTNIEIEVFVHGALCFSYSGQCLMSSMIGGRSGNRGRCAQPCRLPYTLIDRDNSQVASGYLLSPKDIQTLDYIPEMIEAGITSFKIEGRMKRPEYVGAVVGMYRKYIDLYFDKNNDYFVEQEDIKKLAQVFNRGGFSKGYLFCQGSKDMMSFENPKHWGIYLGKVVQYNYKTKKCIIDTVEPLKSGDGIEIWRKGIEHTGVSVSKASKPGEKITIYLKEYVRKGDLVYKTKDKSLLEAIQQTYSKDIRKSNIYGHIRFKKNMPVLLQFWNEKGIFIEVEGSMVEKAKNQALSHDRIKSQISKMGNTPFRMEGLTVDTDEDSYLPIGELNLIRRQGIERLKTAMINDFRRQPKSINKITIELNKNEKYINNNDNKFNVLIKNSNDIEYVFHPRVKRIYLDTNEYSVNEIEKITQTCHKNNTELFVVLPRIDMNYKREKMWYNLENTSIDGFLLRTYGQVYKMKHTTKKKVLDYTFNIFNPLTVNYWMQSGMKGLTLSPELNFEELKGFKGQGLEIIGYGHLPLMTTKQCIIGNTLGIKSLDTSCDNKRSGQKYRLVDRKKEVFPIEQDCSSCVSVIYNSKPILLLKELERIISLSVDTIRLDFYLEEKHEIREIIESYADYKDINNKKYYNREYTKGHYFRGVE